jgi:translin
MDNLDAMAEKIRKDLAARDEAREKMLPLCRDSIRYSSTAIRAVHRHEFGEASKLVQNARDVLTEAEKAVAGHPDLANTGAVRDAQKELAEASITLALVTGQLIPGPESLKVDTASYLNGMGEAVGELRRFLLDGMRKGDLSRGEELLAFMDDIYSMLVTMDFPDALTGGLRRTTDMVRGVLEKTRSDLTLAMQQKALETRIAELQREKLVVPGPDGNEIQVMETRETIEEALELNAAERDLYNELDAWRSKKANEENLAPFIVARNSALQRVARLRPGTSRELGKIMGFGERRANKYGRDIIAIIKKHG